MIATRKRLVTRLKWAREPTQRKNFAPDKMAARIAGFTLQLTTTSDPLELDRGCRVVVHGLTSSAGLLLNGTCGTLGGALGAVTLGRYPVFFKGSKGYKHIKPCNLRANDIAVDLDAATNVEELQRRIEQTDVEFAEECKLVVDMRAAQWKKKTTPAK